MKKRMQIISTRKSRAEKFKKIMQNILSIFTICLCAATYLPIPNSDLPAAFISAHSRSNTLIRFSYSSISEKIYIKKLKLY